MRVRNFDMAEVAKAVAASGSFRALAGRVAGAGTGFLVTILLPLVLPLADVGAIYLAISLAATLSVFQRMGLDYAALQIATGAADGQRSSAAVLLHVLACFATVNAFMLPLLAAGLLHFGEAVSLPAGFDLFALLTWSTGLAISFTIFQIYKSDGKALSATLTRSFFHTFGFCLLLIAMYVAGVAPPLAVVLWLFAGVALLVAIANSWSVLSGGRTSSGATEFQPVRQEIRHAVPFFGYSLAVICFSEVDIWLASANLSPEDVAMYATAKRLMLFSAMFVDVANIVLPGKLRPLWQKKDFAAMETVLKLFALRFSLISVLVLIAVGIVGFFAFPIIFPDFSVALLPLLLILLGGQSLALLFGFSETVLIMAGSRRALVRAALIGTVVHVIVGQALVGQIGIIGIAIGAAVGTAAFRIELARLARTRLGIRTIPGVA